MSNTKTVMSQAANTQGLPLDITDVFSTYLYEGKGAAGPSGGQTITNGIDLAGEGGLVWIKSRNNTYDHRLTDTERGIRKSIETQSTEAEADTVHCVSGSFNSDGFSIGDTGTPSAVNTFGDDYASWTFRKAPKFFDVVRYTGDASDQVVSHSLGSTPGCIIIKATSTTGDWTVYHRGLTNNGANHSIKLNSTAAQVNQGGLVATDSTFTLYHTATVNTNNVSYVAYLFAHNDGDGEFGPSGDQDIIKCGSFTSDGSGLATVDVGFEPQWVLYKASTAATHWSIADSMRGFVADTASASGKYLNANSASAELSNAPVGLTNTGFKYNSAPNIGFIYMAIRCGPLAPPESGTEVFATDHRGSSAATAAGTSYYSGFPVDMTFGRNRTYAGGDTAVYDRLRGDKNLFTNLTNAEGTASYYLDSNTGFWGSTQSENTAQSAWMFRRAPNFFDVVAYTGNSASGRTVSHNLGVVPEMMWIKRRDITASWCVYHSAIGATGSLDLDNTGASNAPNAGARFDDTEPTSSVFTVGNFSETNNNNNTYIAYLFSTLAGISKVGSYTGNDSSQTIDCGFTSGARFILIKKAIGGIGNWYIFDSVRGIIAGNDPNLRLDNTGAEQALADIVDPHNSGFIVNSAGGLNASGSTYIFYAIA